MREATLFLRLLPLLSLSLNHAQTFGEFKDVNGTLVKCRTTAASGKPFIIEVKPDWAPLGAQRFLELVKSEYFTDVSC